MARFPPVVGESGNSTTVGPGLDVDDVLGGTGSLARTRRIRSQSMVVCQPESAVVLMRTGGERAGGWRSSPGRFNTLI
jgi:hypothetical protein